MKLLFLAPYPLNSSPSQRFRFEQYFKALDKAGHEYRFQSFLTPNGWKVIYKKGNQVKKAWAIINGFVRRIFVLPSAVVADRVFIHRELSPIGPPIFEWMIAKLFRKKVIYDFDDAIWLTDVQHEGWLTKALRWRRKVDSISRWAHAVSCGNEYLRNYASQFNPNARYNPTTIDTKYHRPLKQENKTEIVIGWTGSHSTLKYLDTIVPVMQELEKKYPHIVFMVIANKRPEINVNCLRFVTWNEQTEIEDLAKIDIGIMPLPDDEWSKGKCGFKLLQYMAMEIAAVASPIGVNTTIVTDNIDGFICNTTEEWIDRIEKLIVNPELRKQFGKAGRSKIKTSYSVASNRSNFLSFFEESEITASATR